MLLVGRFIIGIGIGIANVACDTYVAETSNLTLLYTGLWMVYQPKGLFSLPLSIIAIG